MAEDRSEMEAARLAGLAKRHETREARAVRREVANEIAVAILARAHSYGDSRQRDVIYDMERLAREIGSRDPA